MMNCEKEFELQKDEREAINSLHKEKLPPSILEEHTVRILKNRGLIVPRTNYRWFHPAAMVGSMPLILAVSLAIIFGAGFGLGYLTGKGWGSSIELGSSSQKFLLVLWEFPAQEKEPSNEEIQKMIGEYSRWASDVNESGNLISGEKLAGEIGILRKTGDRLVMEEKSFGKEQRGIAGYFMIRAENFQHALRIAKDCPHLKYGGEIEVRGIERL